MSTEQVSVPVESKRKYHPPKKEYTKLTPARFVIIYKDLTENGLKRQAVCDKYNVSSYTLASMIRKNKKTPIVPKVSPCADVPASRPSSPVPMPVSAMVSAIESRVEKVEKVEKKKAAPKKKIVIPEVLPEDNSDAEDDASCDEPHSGPVEVAKPKARGRPKKKIIV